MQTLAYKEELCSNFTMDKKITVNQYFQKPVGSGSNFFDDISSSSGPSAMMASVIESGSSHDLFHASTNSSSSYQTQQLLSGIANMQIDKSGQKNPSVTSASSKSDEGNNMGSKEEPVLCRIFAMQDEISSPVEKAKPSLGKTFFDTLGSTSPTSILQFGSGSSGIDFMMPDPVNSILPPGLNSDESGGFDELFGLGPNTKGPSGEYERRRDAWIPSERTRRGLIAAATAKPGTFFPERDLLTMPGVILEEDMVDSVTQLVTYYLGEADANQRKVLTMNDVTQDERGLRELIQAECYRAAVNLTGRLLTIYGQGVGRAGHPSKHTVHSIQLWFTRLALLVKLRAYSVAEAEGSVWWDCDRPDLYYQFYPELYGGRLGTLIPFQMRLLLAVMPSFSKRYQEALDRLYSVLAVVKKIQYNLDNGRSEDGSQLELSPQDRAESKRLWRSREIRIHHAVVNIALQQKDYWLAVEVLEMLAADESSPVTKRALHSALGRIFLQLGDIAGAEKNFSVSRSLKQKQLGTLGSHAADFRELIDRGLMAVAQNCFQDAYNSFEKAALMEPSNIMVVNNLAVCLLYMGRLKDAIKLLCSAVNNNPSLALHGSLLLNLCTLFELESSFCNEKKLALLKVVSKYKGDAVAVTSLKLPCQFS